MSIKALALDLNGTVLDPFNNISGELAGLLTHLREKGIKIFIATSKTIFEIKDSFPSQTICDGLVVANGMGCYINKEKIFEYTLPPSLVEKVIQMARKEKIYYEAHPLETGRFALMKDQAYMVEELLNPIPPTLNKNELLSRRQALAEKINWVKEIDTFHLVKIYFFSMNPEKIRRWKQALQQLQPDHPFTILSSSDHNVEIMTDNVSKATGIRLLLEEYGLSPKDLMAVGDGENDLPMFDLAGYSVAMKNASETVQSKADEVTAASYEENGLYLFLREKFRDLL